MDCGHKETMLRLGITADEEIRLHVAAIEPCPQEDKDDVVVTLSVYGVRGIAPDVLARAQGMPTFAEVLAAFRGPKVRVRFGLRARQRHAPHVSAPGPHIAKSCLWSICSYPVHSSEPPSPFNRGHAPQHFIRRVDAHS